MAQVFGPMDTDSYNEPDDVNTDLDTLIEKRNLLGNSNLQPRYENKAAGTFMTGIDIFSKEEQQKLGERAKRFGIKENPKQIDVEDEGELYESMGVGESESAKYTRFNALHMRGTDEMSTQDVFDYFKDYAPASIEWINDVSCNVVWLDKVSAARALIGLSKKIVGSKETQLKDEQDDAMEGLADKTTNSIDVKAIDFPLPPGVWRKGVECPKSKTILLRFATSSDKKQANAEKLSEYYKKHGNPNYGGIKGILTQSRKRKYKDDKTSKWQDDELGSKEGFKNPWGTLSEEWGVQDPVEVYQIRPVGVAPERTGIKERLGFKPKEVVKTKVEEKSTSGSESDSDDGWNKRNKVMRMRMHADDEEEKVQKKRLKQMAQKMQEKISGTDLRSRLGRSKPTVYHEPIRVTVTNPEYSKNLHLEESEEEEVEEVEEEVEEVEEVDEDEAEVSQVEDKEEGEWEDEETAQEPEESDSDSSSDLSEKEVQGPKGSVIKVITRPKPTVASTVWARLNQNEKRTERTEVKNVKGDLRSRLGYHNRGRSPLRIEVKNDKYGQDSDSE
ncbi:nuclear cap-binding protein subunit 3-like [Microplitis mediator]|uniref:nuclear cap-binding protein subunit 3-like n=1 Tax=Microplitis mediator TaxID=375433 RepID=UPI002556F678|nr:nuclear cap-binding protein subunit 3-like [Microplitis mediator]